MMEVNLSLCEVTASNSLMQGVAEQGKLAKS